VLAGAALLLRSFAVLLDENPGFDARGVVAIDVSIPYGVDKAAPLFRTQVLPALRALPGVEQVAAANTAPMSLLPTEHSRWATRFGIEGRAFESGQYPVAQVRYVTPQYFGVLAIPLKRGQWLTAADDGKPRCLINEALATRFFGGQDPVGKRLVLGVVDPKQTAVEIAGMVGGVRDFGLDEEPAPTFYAIDAGSGTLLVKTVGTTTQLEREIRETVHRIDAEIVVRQERPLEQNIADSLAQRRFALTLLAAFAGLAAVLTAAGIYGLMAYSVNARIREFGVRAAVGATPANLVRMILRGTAAVAMPGLAAGLVLALAFARYMKSVVYRVSLFDPWAIASAGIFLILIALLSAWLPARRAASVDAAAALRSD
jgi:putative ABC transport system permease protein